MMARWVSSSVCSVRLLSIRDSIFRLYRMVHAMNHEKQPTFAFCPARNFVVVTKVAEISLHGVEVSHPLQPGATHYSHPLQPSITAIPLPPSITAIHYSHPLPPSIAAIHYSHPLQPSITIPISHPSSLLLNTLERGL
jgi:hypothetical protein